jgi:ABC-type siderophore export system fused ATPase/permease subunit
MSEIDVVERINKVVDGLRSTRRSLYCLIGAGVFMLCVYAFNFVLLLHLKVMNAAMILVIVIMLLNALRRLRQNLEACRKAEAALAEHEQFVTGRPVDNG